METVVEKNGTSYEKSHGKSLDLLELSIVSHQINKISLSTVIIT